jgi:hypothetical protein
MTLMTTPRPQAVNREEMGEYKEIQRDLRPMYTAEHRAMYPPLASTLSTVRSVSRELEDRELANANMATKPSDMGLLTEEQKQARDRHKESLRAMLSNHLIEKQEREMRAHVRSARTAYTVPNFNGYQASYHCSR